MPQGWLRDAEDAEATRDLDRLVADSEMLLQLQLEGYEGKAWDYFSDVLARYGYAVLFAWLVRGTMLAKCKEKRIRGLPPELGPIYGDDAAELAGEVVAVAIHYFRKTVLKRHRWDPKGGASLRTFFIGQCLIRFPDVYRPWRKEAGRDIPTENVVCDDRDSPDDLEITVVQRIEIDQALREIDERTGQVLRLLADGLTQKEIARTMAEQNGEPMSAKAVEAILYRHRRRQQRKGA